MNTEDRFDDLLTEGLRADAPREAPSRLLDATMNRIADTPQRGGGRLGGPAGRLLAAAVVLLAVLAGTQLAGLIGRPAGTSPSPSATVAPSASATTSSPTPSASSSPAIAPAWTATGNMIDARANHTATLLPDGKVLVAGGGGQRLLASAELYDPGSGSWTATGSMNGTRTAHTATLLPDGKVLVAGGADSISETSVNALASAELYDPASGTWTATGSMIEAARPPHGHPAARRQGARGGRQWTATAAPRWPPPSCTTRPAGPGPPPGTWSRPAPATRPRCCPMAGCSWRVATAAAASARRQPSCTTPAPGPGPPPATMVRDHAGHTATLLPDGRVLVLGGSSGSRPEGTVELYDPRTESWAATANMNGEHLGGTATLLGDGSVLLAGGGSSGGSGGEELFDPGTGSWTATVSMLEGRTNHTATLLDDGSVLMVGGVSPRGMLATAELYEPGSGSR